MRYQRCIIMRSTIERMESRWRYPAGQPCPPAAAGPAPLVVSELVSDRATKAPADKGVVQALYEKAYEEGVMVRTSSNNVIISPCLVIEKQHVERIIAALDDGLTAAAKVQAKAK